MTTATKTLFQTASKLPEGARERVIDSLNASLAQWLVGAGRVEPPYVAAQGTALGRSGRPHISRTPDGSIWVGGATRTIVEGAVEVARLPSLGRDAEPLAGLLRLLAEQRGDRGGHRRAVEGGGPQRTQLSPAAGNGGRRPSR